MLLWGCTWDCPPKGLSCLGEVIASSHTEGRTCDEINSKPKSGPTSGEETERETNVSDTVSGYRCFSFFAFRSRRTCWRRLRTDCRGIKQNYLKWNEVRK